MIHSVQFTAILDTNVMFPVITRDILLWFAHYDLYTPKWSKHIFDEWRDVMSVSYTHLDVYKRQIDRGNRLLMTRQATMKPSVVSSVPSFSLVLSCTCFHLSFCLARDISGVLQARPLCCQTTIYGLAPFQVTPCCHARCKYRMVPCKDCPCNLWSCLFSRYTRQVVRPRRNRVKELYRACLLYTSFRQFGKKDR